MAAAQEGQNTETVNKAGGQTAELMRRLVSLRPDADRDTLIQTVDDAVQAVLERLKGHAPGASLPEDLVQLTTVTLSFLEACMGMNDPTFAGQARTWATELQTALSTAMAPAPAAQAKEPSKKKKKKAKPAPAPEKPKEPVDAFERFQQAFTEYLARYIRQKAESFEIMGKQDRKLPFPIAPAFSLIFEQIIAKFIVPRMMKNRRIKNISESLGEDQLRVDVFFKMFDKPERENPVLIIWNDVWNEVSRASAPAEDKSKKKKPAADAKKSWLSKISNWKSKDDSNKAEARGADTSKQIWDAFVAGGVDGNFDPPKPSDIPLLQMLFLYERDPIDIAKESVTQLINQESKGKASEGVTRDFLNRSIKDMPDFAGELLSLWAYIQHRDLFNEKMLRSFQTSNGKTAQERKRFLPLFMRWVPDYTRLK